MKIYYNSYFTYQKTADLQRKKSDQDHPLNRRGKRTNTLLYKDNFIRTTRLRFGKKLRTISTNLRTS